MKEFEAEAAKDTSQEKVSSDAEDVPGWASGEEAVVSDTENES